MSRERGQALVEAVLVLPLCLAAGLAIVDCGVVVRDRIAVAQAATRAAEAELAGRDAAEAARGALPAQLRHTLRISEGGGSLTLHATTNPRVLPAPDGIVHASRVVVEVAP